MTEKYYECAIIQDDLSAYTEDMLIKNCRAKINQIYVAKDGWESTIVNQLFGIKCKPLEK